MNITQLLILGRTMRSLDSAGRLLASLDAQGRNREAVSLMKIATHLNKAVIETARMMIMVAPEGVDVSSFDAVISEASTEAARLEIAAINVEASLEDAK